VGVLTLLLAKTQGIPLLTHVRAKLEMLAICSVLTSLLMAILHASAATFISELDLVTTT